MGTPAQGAALGPLCISGWCRRKDGTQLAAATIQHVGLLLATWANNDGTAAHPGISKLAVTRHRVTVIGCLRHLETVGLVMVTLRGSSSGVPRWMATEYQLSMPESALPFPAAVPPPALAMPPIPAASSQPPDGQSWFHSHHPPVAAR